MVSTYSYTNTTLFLAPFPQRKPVVTQGENILPCTTVLLIYKNGLFFSPDEYPFTNNLPEPVLQRLQFPSILHPNKINANPSILSFYTCAIVPRITRRATLLLATKKRAQGIMGDEEYEDDGNYGSAATLDVEVLQSISKRVHYGWCHTFFNFIW